MITIASSSQKVSEILKNFGIEITGQDANVIIYAITIILSLYLIKYLANKIIGFISIFIFLLTVIYFFSNDTNKKHIHDTLNIKTIAKNINKENIEKGGEILSNVIEEGKKINIENIKEISNDKELFKEVIGKMQEIKPEILNKTLNELKENSEKIIK